MAPRRSWWCIPAILVGILGGISICGFAFFQAGMTGLATAACSGGGCERRLANEAAYWDRWIAGGAIGGLVLVASGAFGLYLDRLRARAAAESAPEVELAEARVVSPRPADLALPHKRESTD